MMIEMIMMLETKMMMEMRMMMEMSLKYKDDFSLVHFIYFIFLCFILTYECYPMNDDRCYLRFNSPPLNYLGPARVS